MDFSDYKRRIRALGRDITPDLVAQTQALVASLVAAEPPPDCRVQRDVRYGSHERNRLDIFTANEDDTASRATLIYVHGGAFVMGDKHTPGSPFYSNIGHWAAAQGFVGVTLTYRLAPQHQWPSGIEDLHHAIQFLRHEGKRYGVGQGPLFLMGQSAGATHVAGYIAHPEIYQGYAHELAGAILLSGIYDFTSYTTGPTEAAYLGTDQSRYGERSALRGLVESDVPLLVSVAEMDPPLFEQQGLQLLSALHTRHGQLPRFVHALGQNHISPALFLGLENDLLAPQLFAFIHDHAG